MGVGAAEAALGQMTPATPEEEAEEEAQVEVEQVETVGIAVDKGEAQAVGELDLRAMDARRVASPSTMTTMAAVAAVVGWGLMAVAAAATAAAIAGHRRRLAVHWVLAQAAPTRTILTAMTIRAPSGGRQSFTEGLPRSY